MQRDFIALLQVLPIIGIACTFPNVKLHALFQMSDKPLPKSPLCNYLARLCSILIYICRKKDKKIGRPRNILSGKADEMDQNDQCIYYYTIIKKCHPA